MEKSLSLRLGRIERMLLCIIGVLIIMVLLLSAIAKNTVVKIRDDGDFKMVESITYRKAAKEDAPIGLVCEHRFTLDDVSEADTLSFYVNHHNIDVYIAEECVYSVSKAGGVFKTTGGIWTMIPLEEEDSGKEVRVVLSPIYKDYQNEMPNFFIGSKLAVYTHTFYHACPEIVLSLCTIMAGVFLLCLGIYQSINKKYSLRIYSIGVLAISAGVWRFTYGRFAYLLFPNHTIFMFTLSVISLMIVSLSMLNCVDAKANKKLAKVVKYCSFSYCAVFTVQLFLQFTGILDLRQMLKIVHVVIILSAVILCVSSVSEGIQQFSKDKTTNVHNYTWILSIGTVTDLLLYYFAETSVGMLFTLGAILLFSMLEGAKQLMIYSKQKSDFEEMKSKLALSRTTTMMSQIRSHFVFNILNAISGMCKYDPEKADETVVRFARYLRNNINIMENDENIPFETDLQQLEDYVILEQVRFGDKIEFYTDIEVDDFMIPPLILQPVVENAIKHGISKKLTNGTIILKTREFDGKIIITVEDDGVGFDMDELAKTGSVGLKNIKFRLEHLVNGTFDILSEKDKGTIVTITIPRR